MIPKTIVKLYATATAALKSGNPKDLQEALKIQDIVSTADWCIIKAGASSALRKRVGESSVLIPRGVVGIAGTKYALDAYVENGLGGFVRKPLPEADAACKAMVDKGIKAALAYENSLP